MKFGWVQDMDIFCYGGGAQLTDLGHFKEGLKRGHDIYQVIPNSDANVLLSTDAVIISNCTAFPPGFFQQLVERNKKLIWFFHDYFCKYRLYFPMLEKCHTCYLRERWLPIFNKSTLFIWLAPLHRDSWLWTYPELQEKPYALVPSAIDTKQFYDLKQQRKGVLSSNTLFGFKGRTNVIRWAAEHPDVQVTFIGGNERPEIALPENCLVLGQQSHFAMNELFNQFEFLLHLPNTPQPFERVIAEAYLAGCNIIGNHLIGALSYDWFTSREMVAEHVQNSPKLFWERIEGALSEKEDLS
jgi:hypothetical protein